MKGVGWALFIIGTLAAAAAGARIPPHWVVFGLGCVLAVAGAVLLRRDAGAVVVRRSEQGASPPGLPGNSDAAGPESVVDLPSLRAELDELNGWLQDALRASSDEALKGAIERILTDGVTPIIEARALLSRAHGVEAYARVYTPLAACERCLNRAWSAVVDGHASESRAQTSAARQHLADAVRAWPVT